MSTARLRKYVSDCRTLPGDVLGAWRTGGSASVWLELRRRTVDRAAKYTSGLVIETDLSGVAEIPPPPGIEIAPFAGPDWGLLGDLVGDRSAAGFAAAAAAGRSCVVAWRGGRAVGYAWASPAVEARYESFQLPLPADAIYAWHTLVARGDRGTGIGSALVSSELRLARAQGYRRSWTVILRENLVSLGTVVAVGPSRVVGTVTRVKVLSSMYSRYRELPHPRAVEELLANCGSRCRSR